MNMGGRWGRVINTIAANPLLQDRLQATILAHMHLQMRSGQDTPVKEPDQIDSTAGFGSAPHSPSMGDFACAAADIGRASGAMLPYGSLDEVDASFNDEECRPLP